MDASGNGRRLHARYGQNDRPAAIGRKNFYGSGSQWSGQLTATMLSVLMTAKLWKLNPRTWLTAYLQACAENGNRAPPDLRRFLPWAMNAEQIAAMRSARVKTHRSKPAA